MNRELLDRVLPNVIDGGIRLLLAALVVLIGRWLARASRRWLAAVLARTSLTASMVAIFLTLAYYGVWLLAAMLTLQVLGVPAQAVIAPASVVLVILGIALQQSLRDLAAGVMFVLFKPFQVGDLIETKGSIGTVEEIQLFSTVLVTAENKVVTHSNSEIRTSGIINSTFGGSRSEPPETLLT